MSERTTFSALVAAACVMAVSGSAQAAPAFAGSAAIGISNGEEAAWQHSRDRHYRDDHRYRRSYSRAGYGEPVYRDTRVWRGRDGRYYCRKKDGTTGLIIGGALGALLGRQIDGGYDRSTGTILGAAGGALLGRSIARGGARCR